MKILVTGSSGTIGTRLCETLLQRSYDVMGVDWTKNKWQPAVNSITTLVDLRDEGATQNINADGVDVIVHLAANARVYDLVGDPARARDNIITTFNVLEFARKKGIRKVLFASSRECYGNLPARKFKESLARIENCESPYTASKIAGEALVESYTRCYGIDHIIFRFSNVYGMYDDSDRIVPLFIRKMRATEPVMIFGEDKCLDFTYIDDTVEGIIAAILKFDTVKNQTFNLAYGEGTALLALAKSLKRLLKSKSEVTLGASRTGEVVRYVADITKAKEALGYDPKVGFRDGIQKSVEWYTRNT
ncbi:NAD-dependent epimerase/dehydratase family protein [Candidatus Peribacteria bacterium]|nr:NAD-dependent epimerase/dehydratase family protein [Candidatus Peribacteria bacterium]